MFKIIQIINKMKTFLIILLKTYLFLMSLIGCFALPSMIELYWLYFITIPLWFALYITALKEEWIG